jgi:UDP-N-acetylglucosamine--N-acetylmuramyl-(pentapeptide) pyrophosphoryl-undecaprenol N-acetylglucosamine transferase
MSKSTLNTSSKPRPTVALIGSIGGHVDLLVAVRKAFDMYQRVWLMESSARADGLRKEGEDIHILPPYARNPLRGNMLGNLRVAAQVLRRYRPSIVIAAGAGICIPFAVLARLSGVKVIFVETMARVSEPSLTGRVLSRLAIASFVQWEQMAAAYPRSIVCQPALLAAGSSRIEVSTRPDAEQGQGTFVGLGTHVQPFDRILEMVDDAVGDGILPHPVTVQHGVTDYHASQFSQGKQWFLPDELEDAVLRSKYVVCHAGSGIISLALRTGRRPMVLPREKRAGEHVDDHQFQLADQLGEMGLIVRLTDRIDGEHAKAALEPVDPKGLDAFPPVTLALERTLSGAVPL